MEIQVERTYPDLTQLRRIYADWNLLAHHGGVFTESYRMARPEMNIDTGDVYRQSLVVTCEDFEEWVAFLDNWVRSLLVTIHYMLEECVNWDEIEMVDVLREALWFLSAESVESALE